MFDKIKYIIDMNIIGFWYSFYTNYMKRVLKNNFSFCSKQTEIFDRPEKYLSGLPDGDYDYTINDYPVWVESIDSTEFINLVNIFPNISQLGLITPFCAELFDTVDQTKIIGYLILIPCEYYDNDKLYEFVLGHELGHISNDHLSSINNGEVLNDIDKEIEADEFSTTRYQDGYLPMKDCISELNTIFEIAISSTIKNIPYLKKKDENKIDDIVYRFKKYNKSYKKRLEAISKLV